MTPRVSVLLPCHDAAATLDEALSSLVRQTFEDFEIVAVDDGSVDTTPSVLGRWDRRDGRLRVIRTDHRGLVPALNAGATAARGDLLARMDADDIALAHRLEHQVAFLDRHPRLAACGTRIRYIPRDRLREGARRYERWINGVTSPDDIERDLFIECPLPHPTLVIRRSAFRSIDGYRDAGWPEDYDLLFRLWEAGERLGKVPEVLVLWREHPARLSRTHSRYTEDAFRRCKAHFLRHRLAGRSVVICGAGPMGKAFARALQAVGVSVAAFVDLDRRKIGQVIHGAPVTAPSAIGAYPHAYFLAAVGATSARWEIRAYLRDAGLREPQDYCAVA